MGAGDARAQGPVHTRPLSLMCHQADWRCPACGVVTADQLRLYALEGLFNTHSRRIGPWCNRCGQRVSYPSAWSDVAQAAPAGSDAGVTILTGTCASGKSSVSYLLSERYGYVQIDGDWLLHQLKQENGRTPDAMTAHAVLLETACGTVRLGRPVVIAHLVLPEHFDLYRTFWALRGIAHRIVVLMPSEPVVLARNLHRKCWPQTTPEYWVQTFRQAFMDAGDWIRPHLYDNTDETPEQTAACLADVDRQGPLAGDVC